MAGKTMIPSDCDIVLVAGWGGGGAGCCAVAVPATGDAKAAARDVRTERALMRSSILLLYRVAWAECAG